MNVSKFKVAFFENFSQTFNCARGTRVSGSIPERGSGGESHTHRAQYAAGSACGKKIPEYRLRYGRHTFCRDHRTYQGSQYFSPGQRLKAGHLCGQMCRKWYPITAARCRTYMPGKQGQGFRPLADYIHGLGLKFGIHIMRGIPRAAAPIITRKSLEREKKPMRLRI